MPRPARPAPEKRPKPVKACPSGHGRGWYMVSGLVCCDACGQEFTVAKWHAIHNPLVEPTEEEIEQIKASVHAVAGHILTTDAARWLWTLGARPQGGSHA